MQSELYEAMGTLFVSEENKNNDFIQKFLCQRSPLCLSISPYAVYALLYHPRHKDALFLHVFSFDLKENSAMTFIPFLDLDSVIYLAVYGTVIGLRVFIQNILNCVLKTN